MRSRLTDSLRNFNWNGVLASKTYLVRRRQSDGVGCAKRRASLSLALAVNPLGAAPRDGTNTFSMVASAGAKIRRHSEHQTDRRR